MKQIGFWAGVPWHRVLAD